MLGSIGRRSNSSSWRGWGSTRRVRLFAALSLAALVLAAALAGVAVPAQAAPQRAAVSGLTAQPGDNPGELTIAWDAHPDGATDYRVALAPADGEYSPRRDSTWNAYPTDTTVTFSGLVQDAEYKLKVRARFKPAVSGAKRSDWSQAASGAAAAETLPDEPTSDDGASSNSVGSQIGKEKSTSVPDGPEPGPGIVTRIHTLTSIAQGRSPDNPFLLTLRAGNPARLDPLFEPPPESATLTFHENPDYQYGQGSRYYLHSDIELKHYSSFTLTNAASVKIRVTGQSHDNAKLSLYVGQDEHRIVKHADGQGWSGNTFVDSISFVDLQPGTYGIRMEQTNSNRIRNDFTLKLLAIPIDDQPDAALLNGGIWTVHTSSAWQQVQATGMAVAGSIGSGSSRGDVSDWYKLRSFPAVTASTDDPDVTLDSVMQITVRSDHGAWFLLWNSDGKSIGYGLANGRVATGYKWASDLQAERDVYIEIRPSAAALEVMDDNGFTVYVTRLYEACTEIIDGLTTLVAFECD